MNLIKTNLTETQKEAIKFFLERNNVGIRHGTGLGKTFISLYSLAHLLTNNKIDACYIFVIKSALDAFIQDFEKHTNLNYSIIYNKSDWKYEDKIYLVQYNRINEFKDIILSEDRRLFGIFDECFVLKNPQRIKNKEDKIPNVNIIFSLRYKFKYVMGLSAIPLGNDLLDLYHITKFISPNFYINEWTFKHTFCDMVQEQTWDKRKREFRKYWKIVGYKNLDKLKDIISNYWHSAFIPFDIDFHLDTSPSTVLNEEENRNYIEAARGLLNNTRNKEKLFINRLPDLQRVVDNSETKKKFFIDFINDLLKLGNGIIVYFELKEPIKDIKRGINADVKILTGETSLKNRSIIREWFGPNKVILMTWAGSRSLNLEKGNQLVFYTAPWSIELFTQSVGRISRPLTSQYNRIDVWIPYVDNTIDLYRREVILNSAGLINEVLDGSDPNLPNNIKMLKQDAIKKLRNDLLWRIKK